MLTSFSFDWPPSSSLVNPATSGGHPAASPENDAGTRTELCRCMPASIIVIWRSLSPHRRERSTSCYRARPTNRPPASPARLYPTATDYRPAIAAPPRRWAARRSPSGRAPLTGGSHLLRSRRGTQRRSGGEPCNALKQGSPAPGASERCPPGAGAEAVLIPRRLPRTADDASPTPRHSDLGEAINGGQPRARTAPPAHGPRRGPHGPCRPSAAAVSCSPPRVLIW